MISPFRTIRDALLDFFFPPRCASCVCEGSFFCPACLRQLKISPSLMHREPGSALRGLIYVFKYHSNPAIQKAIERFKYRYNTAMADYLAALILKKLNRLHRPLGSFILVPVPLHRRRRYERGFNQAEVLARAMHRFAGLPVCHGLRRVRHTTQQAKLSRCERLQNLKNGFEPTPALRALDPKTPLFLVDDVYTTGTTLNECARTLKRAGYQEVYGLVIAKA